MGNVSRCAKLRFHHGTDPHFDESLYEVNGSFTTFGWAIGKLLVGKFLDRQEYFFGSCELSMSGTLIAIQSNIRRSVGKTAILDVLPLHALIPSLF